MVDQNAFSSFISGVLRSASSSEKIAHEYVKSSDRNPGGCNDEMRSVSRQENRVEYARTFEHRVADIVMGADIAP